MPSRLEFIPHESVRGCFAGRPNCDYRDVLADLEPGTTLYDIVAHEAEDHSSRTIGTIRTDSRFIASAVGDQLFFRHVQAQRDLRREHRS